MSSITGIKLSWFLNCKCVNNPLNDYIPLTRAWNTATILIKCCMRTLPHPCAHFYLACSPLFFLFAPPSLPPVLLFPSVNSGSNETSIWPVRQTQTSLPLWEEELNNLPGRGWGDQESRNMKGKVARWRGVKGWMKRRSVAQAWSCQHRRSRHVSSLWRAVLIADVRTALDEKISRGKGKMWAITKGTLCWTVWRHGWATCAKTTNGNH